MKTTGQNIKTASWWWLVLLVILVAVNFIASSFHTRIDLTKEKRYTLSKATTDLVRKIDDKIEIQVFLKGDFPSGFRKLANSTEEFLQLLKDRNSARISYRFISPQDKVEGTEIVYGDSLTALGAVPINLTVQKQEGQSSNIIFPVAVMKYKDRQVLVNLYPGSSGRISQDEINSAEALMEYQFANALDKLITEKRAGIAYATGNGEPVDQRVFDLGQIIGKDYDFGLFNLQSQPIVPDKADILLIVKPTQQFTEEEKLKIDQFVMRGGKLLCFIDNLIAEQDSLAYSKGETIAYDRNLNLTDLFFRYGLRMNTDLIMDLQCDMIPFMVGGTAENPQFEFLHWNYFPFLISSSNKLNNLGYIGAKFVNSIDTINVPGIKKTVLLSSSPNARTISTPARISLNENRNAPEDAQFKKGGIPAAVLLEGRFTSLYRSRASQSQRDSLTAQGKSFLNEAATDNKIVVVADGDIVFNDYIPNPNPGERPIPLPMGFNKYTFREYQNQTEGGKYFMPVANREFVLNTIEYLVNNPAISETRNKDIVLRLLDSQKVKANKLLWQLINIAVPILLVILAGVVYQGVRRRKYAK